MTVNDVEHIMEQWAPRWIAWERDNVGLQVGDRSSPVRRILVSLDVTEDVVGEAVTMKADLLISHHPLLFRPATSITTSDPVGRMILKLARHGIALYSAHTNLDFTRDGVSVSLARALGLKNIRFLSPLKGLMAKIAVFVPEHSVPIVLDAMTKAGAGVIGDYSHCSFQINGRGTFLGSGQSNPTVGTKGKLESVDEVRLEMILPRTKVRAVTSAMKSAHPYEEVAYDVYPLENESAEFGMGAIGELKTALPLKTFLTHVRKALRAEGLRMSGKPAARMKKIAVCGGSGSDLIPEAIRAQADAFVTADVRYHSFHDAGNLALIDAGHWETEHPVLDIIRSRLTAACADRREKIHISITNHKTSPIHFS
ncbi:MAG: Nif3-like dinuclear metal center hexameric protein [Bacteroidota bacterium]